jgi:GntR family transcriptional regulator
MAQAKPITFQPGFPLYRQVQKQIEKTIRKRGVSKDLILTDVKLSERFGVSRITVRRAVDELVDAGVLYRIQGVGTFVRPRKLREKLTLNSFLDTWSRHDGKLEVQVGAFERITADGELAARLQSEVGEPLVYVQRLRFQNNALIAVDDRYLRVKHCRLLTTQDITTSSLVDYLRNREKVKLDRGEMDIEARGASDREARVLKIKKGRPILVRRMSFYDVRDEPVLIGVSTYRADKVTYRLTVSA